MVYTIDQIREIAVPIAENYGIRRMSLFGSYARGEANDASDVDILIDEGRLRGLLQYMGFVLDLEDSLGCHVDVVMDGIEDKAFLSSIQKDEVIFYEAI